MPARKGVQPRNAPRGRKKGAANKITRNMRELITGIVDKHADQVSGWITRVAKKNPDRATELWLRAAEYVTPKLMRAELSADVNHHGLLDAPVITVSDPVEAARQYQLMIEAGKEGRPAPRVNYVSDHRSPPPTPPQQPAPVMLEQPQAAQSLPAPAPMEPVPPAIAPERKRSAQRADTAAVDPDDPTVVAIVEPLREFHEHRPKADSTCPKCRQLWVTA